MFAWRASALSGSTAFSLISREISLVLNNLLLTVSCGIVLVGTLYPMALEALTGDKISVGAPFFNSTVVWIFMPLLLAVPFGIFLAWKRGSLGEAAKRLSVAAILAVIAGAAALAFGADGKQSLAIALGAWVLAGSVWEVLWRARFLSAPLSETARRIWNMRRGQFGATLGHIGLAVTVIGIAGASAWNVERLAVLKIGDTIDLGSYQLTFKKVYEQAGPNYAEFAGDFDLKSGDSLDRDDHDVEAEIRCAAASHDRSRNFAPADGRRLRRSRQRGKGRVLNPGLLPSLRPLDLGRGAHHVSGRFRLAARPQTEDRLAAESRESAVPLGARTGGVEHALDLSTP